MNRIHLLLIYACIFPFCLAAQITREPGKYLPKPTAKGVGKIDTRVDNMGYWRKMADSGFVYVAPVMSVPPAVFSGSGIHSPLVLISDSPDVPTTTVNSTQSENSVFVNPTDNQSLLNSNNSTQNPVGSLYGADYLESSDGGSTWGGSVNGAGGTNSGDPTTAISLTGRQYVNFIDDPGGQGIAYSDDDGSTWTPATIAPNPGSLADKNHMWIDNKSTSPYAGNLYTAWTDFGGTDDTQIKISRSTNNGVTWSTPLNISSAILAGSHNQGVNIQTGPGGEVYAIWAVYDSWPSDESAIGFAKSTNGGVSYASATRIISNIRGIRTTETSKNQRVNSFPSMAVDISGGPHNGNIYIVWTNIGVPGTNTGSDIDVYLIRSTDGGSSWSSPIRVNQDPSGQGKQHYFPWITCDKSTGELSVIFYDDRNVSSTQCEVFVASSLDAGNSWEDFKVSDVAFTPTPIPGLAGGYMGDYLGISALNRRVYPTWTDNRSGTTMTYVSPFDLSPLPTARFSVNTTTPCLNQTAIFQDMTTKNPASWLWSISPAGYSYVNGTNSTSQNPQVQFNAYGNYSVQLIATNTYGSDTLLKTNYISVNYANADFTSNIAKVVINNNVIFTDQSSCNISSYSWNFGTDATPATANTQGPHTVSYSTTGFKTVSLTVNGNVTKTKTDYIEVLPETFNMSNGTLTTCTGTFYDPQGTSNYLDNLDYTMTFMPGDTSKSIQAVFSVFDLEPSTGCVYDWLNIYDGTSTSAPWLGTYCGTSSPGTVVAYNAAGALTFEFHSDGSVVGQGWVAALSCVNTPPPPPPSYCTANATVCDEYISRVQLGSINNATACTSGGYADYTSLYTRVSPGYTYPITVTNGLSYSADQCGIWVDWNQNGSFTDASEVLSVSGTPGGGPYSANIIPPVNAVKGLTRLRARITYTGTVSSCGTTYFGEVEDYSVYVGTPGLWQGGTAGAETDWNTANNWDDGRIPTASTNVVIPQGAAYYPAGSGIISCMDMEIKDGATVTVQPASTLNINGDLNIGQGGTGMMIVNGGTCNVTGIINALQGSQIDLKNGGVMHDTN
jgi:PKD repeat protein